MKKRVIIGEDNIVYVDGSEILNEQEALGLVEEIFNVSSELKSGAKVFIETNVHRGQLMSSSSVRRKLVNEVSKLIKNTGLSKVAVYGKDAFARAVAFFIISAISAKNISIKIFSSKQKALEWLKK